jgi:phosphoglycerol transferase MdoB-like AlkP superfamily enzyme
MTHIPYLEDIYKLHFKNTMTVLFPNKTRNKLVVYLISIFHIIGALVLQWGIFLKPKYLFYYFIYLLLILFSYYIFNNHCFMTLISNKYSGNKKTPLYIKKKLLKI